MSRQDLLKDILRLKLRVGNEIIGMLPDGIQGYASERRREILQAVREVCQEFLWEEGHETQGKEDLKPVSIE